MPRVAAGELSEDERALMEKHGLDEEQIVYRRGLLAEHRGVMAQEFAESAEECFLASGDCVFDVQTIERRLREMEEPVPARAAANRESGPVETGLQILLPPMAGKSYIVGVDPAGGGTRGDYACAEVIDRATGMQCAELHGHFTPREMAVKTAELAKHYNDALLVVERNGLGREMLAYLGQTGCRNLYVSKTGESGWLTTAASRPEAIANLSALIADAPELFNSPKLLREFRTFVRREDGSPRAAAGTHDDCVMAMAIAQAVRREAR